MLLLHSDCFGLVWILFLHHEVGSNPALPVGWIRPEKTHIYEE